ncbi:MAG: hypothetical protein ACI4TM_11625, partial [Candidatus Cryptobacteroides sp.]
DTTKMGFLRALRNVKIFRNNMQIICDSLEYSDVDSLARLFNDPIIWNELRHQYAADSITAVIRNGAMEKASLMSNAFIHVQEDSIHYDQIKGAEMVAYFDKAGELARFDALGGASALFYIEEQGTLATVNKKESKMLSAIFRDGEINRIYYFDTANSDAYPLVQMTREEQQLKGFNWQPKRRPASPLEITTLKLRPVERARYEKKSKAAFRQTEKYFPGYMGDIYRQIQIRDSIQAVRAKERAERQRLESIEKKRLEDSLALADSIALRDSIAAAEQIARKDISEIDMPAEETDTLAAGDSISVSDSLALRDSVAISVQETVPTAEELRQKRLEERQKKRDARMAEKARKKEEKEKRWAELDRRDAEKKKAKEEKKAAKLHKQKLETLKEALRQNEIDNSKLERYKEEYRNKELRRRSKRSRQKDL